MLNTETQWKRAERINIAFGIVGAVLFLVERIWDPLPEYALGGAGAGFVGASIALYFALYRRSHRRLDPEERETLIEGESKDNFRLLLGLIGLALGVVIIAAFPDSDTIILTVGPLMGAVLLYVGFVAFRGLRVARQARSDPALYDERAQARMQQANAKGFTYMLNAALIGGAITIVGGFEIPVWAAFYGPAFVGLMAMLWVMSRDDGMA